MRQAPDGEDIKAATSSGRTCLGECGLWKDKQHFRVNKRYGTLAAYCHECESQINQASSMRSRAKLKREVVDHYGGKCSCCGETEITFLSLDHVNNDGAEERRRITSGTNMWYHARKEGYPDRYQVLCFNCNHGRFINGGVCPHQVIQS